MRNFITLLLTLTIVDFSILDNGPREVRVEAHLSDNTTCGLTMSKYEFYGDKGIDLRIFNALGDRCLNIRNTSKD